MQCCGKHLKTHTFPGLIKGMNWGCRIDQQYRVVWTVSYSAPNQILGQELTKDLIGLTCIGHPIFWHSAAATSRKCIWVNIPRWTINKSLEILYRTMDCTERSRTGSSRFTTPANERCRLLIYLGSKDALGFRRLFICLLQQGPGFNPRSIHVEFVGDKVEWDSFGFPFPVSHHQYCLPIFTYYRRHTILATVSVVKCHNLKNGPSKCAVISEYDLASATKAQAVA